MDRSTQAPPVTAIGLLLVGAGVAAYAAQPLGDTLVGISREGLLLLGAAAVQVGIAAALWIRLGGASRVALVVLIGQWAVLSLVLALMGLVHVVFALLLQQGGPIPDTSLNPMILAALVALWVGASLVYAPVVRSLLPAGRLNRRQIRPQPR